MHTLVIIYLVVSLVVLPSSSHMDRGHLSYSITMCIEAICLIHSRTIKFYFHLSSF